MDEHRTRLVRLAAGQLVVLAGTLHLAIGIRYWLLYAAGGAFVPPDVRVPLWIGSGLAIVVGVVVAVREGPRPVLYALGILAMLVYVLGYFSWHLGGHRSFYLFGDPQLHGVGIVPFLLDHAFAGPIEFVALLIEGLAILLLGVLLVSERR